MNRYTNIAIVGLGQIGVYLYNELRLKKKEIEKKTGKKIKVVAISAKDINKKRRFTIKKIYFIKILYKYLKIKKLIFYLNVLDYLMVYQKRLLKLQLKTKFM